MNTLSIHEGDKQARMAVAEIEVRGPVEVAAGLDHFPYCCVNFQGTHHHAYLDLDHSATCALLTALANAMNCAVVSWDELREGRKN